MTWSTAIGIDTPLDRFGGSSTFDKKTMTRDTDLVGDDASTDEPNESLAYEPPDLTDEVVVDLRPAIDPTNVPLPPVARPVVHRTREEICDTLAKAAQHNDLPISFFIRLLFQESAFQPGVVSSAGAEGIAQFMPETSQSEGLANPFDPLEAIPASARLLKKLFSQFGNLGLAAAAYNAGPKRIQDWLAKKGHLPGETQGYVKTITGRPAETWRVASAGGTALTVPHNAPCQEAVPPPPPTERSHLATAAAASAHGGKSGHSKVVKLTLQIAAAKANKLAKLPKAQDKEHTRELAAAQRKSLGNDKSRKLAAKGNDTAKKAAGKEKNKKFAQR